MQKLFHSCRGLDEKLLQAYALSEDILMEHAALGLCSAIDEYFQRVDKRLAQEKSVCIVAGSGNNGADGIALARLLSGRYSVSLYLPFGVLSLMAKKQLQRVRTLEIDLIDEVRSCDVIVDALLGTGINRPLEKKRASIIQEMNEKDAYVIACDIPSGLNLEGVPSPIAVKADKTVTMGAYKLALYSDYAKSYVGEVCCINLGVEKQYYTNLEKESAYLLEKEDLLLPQRHSLEMAHKGLFGHGVVFCGEKEGASILSAMAMSRFGVGLTTLVGRKSPLSPAYLMYATDIPQSTTAFGIGMGMGKIQEMRVIEEMVQSPLPILLDADALSSSYLLEIVKQTKREIVLTPHPKEFVRLWSLLMNESISVETLQKNRFYFISQFHQHYPHVTLLLKGVNMLIIHQRGLYINPLGDAKLSKGGFGDLLSGLIVALLAQGYSGIDATIQASLAFVCASNLYKGKDYAMLPTDLIENLQHLSTLNSE